MIFPKGGVLRIFGTTSCTLILLTAHYGSSLNFHDEAPTYQTVPNQRYSITPSPSSPQKHIQHNTRIVKLSLIPESHGQNDHKLIQKSQKHNSGFRKTISFYDIDNGSDGVYIIYVPDSKNPSEVFDQIVEKDNFKPQPEYGFGEGKWRIPNEKSPLKDNQLIPRCFQDHPDPRTRCNT